MIDVLHLHHLLLLLVGLLLWSTCVLSSIISDPVILLHSVDCFAGTVLDIVVGGDLEYLMALESEWDLSFIQKTKQSARELRVRNELSKQIHMHLS